MAGNPVRNRGRNRPEISRCRGVEGALQEQRKATADAPPTAREARIGRRRAAAEANARRAQALFEKETVD